MTEQQRENLEWACRYLGAKPYYTGSANILPEGAFWTFPDGWRCRMDRPALAAYAAELLRAEVARRGAPSFDLYVSGLIGKLDEKGDPQDLMVGFSYTDLQGVLYYLDDHDHITAACDALEGES